VTDAHRTIYQTILDASARAKDGLVDLNLVGHALGATGALEAVGGLAYLVGLTNGVPVALFAPEYAARLHEMGTLRRLVALGVGLMQAARAEGATTKELLAGLERSLADLAAEGSSGTGEDRDTLAFAPTLVENYLSWVELQSERASAGSGLTGVTTGLPRLDYHLGGWQPGNLIVLAASTGAGKSALSTCFAYHALKAGKKVAFFSAEMTQNEMMGRFYPMETGMPDARVRTGQLDDAEWAALTRASVTMGDFGLAVDESIELTPAHLRRTCKRVRDTLGGLDLIVVDYYQLMTMGEEARRAARGSQVVELEDIGRLLKQLARAMSVPVIVLAQLSSGINLRTNPEPTLSDIRGCKALVNDADLVFLLHRPELFDPETDRKGQADLILAKGRNMARTRWTLYFNGPLMLFTEIAQRSDFEPISPASGWSDDAAPLSLAV
jgi:replicative DNA helicase